MQIFFNKCTLGSPHPRFCIHRFNKPCIQNSILILGWVSVDEYTPLYARFCTISQKGLGSHGIWYPWGFLEKIPLRYQRRTVVKFWGVNSYMQIFSCAVVGSGVLFHGGLQPLHYSGSTVYNIYFVPFPYNRKTKGKSFFYYILFGKYCLYRTRDHSDALSSIHERLSNLPEVKELVSSK